LPALHGQLADLPNGRGNFFLSPLHGIILAIFQNAKNGRKKTGNLFLISCLGVPFHVAAGIAKNVRKKTGNLFLISCLGVPFHVAAVIQFTNKPDLICPSVVPFRNYSK